MGAGCASHQFAPLDCRDGGQSAVDRETRVIGRPVLVRTLRTCTHRHGRRPPRGGGPVRRSVERCRS